MDGWMGGRMDGCANKLDLYESEVTLVMVNLLMVMTQSFSNDGIVLHI